MAPYGMGPPPGPIFDMNKPPRPQGIKEVPAYLRTLISGFFSRLLYVFKLVWETRPWILFLMMFMALFNGIMPVLNAQIGAMLLNALAGVHRQYRISRSGRVSASAVCVSAAEQSGAEHECHTESACRRIGGKPYQDENY